MPSVTKPAVIKPAVPMPAARSALVDHGLELLAPLGRTRATRMFGGWALYADDLCVALVLQDQLYLKADEAGRAAFAAAGCTPFVYDAALGPVTTSYWSAPADAMDTPALMLPWARLAQRAALAARAGKPALGAPNLVKPARRRAAKTAAAAPLPAVPATPATSKQRLARKRRG